MTACLVGLSCGLAGARQQARCQLCIRRGSDFAPDVELQTAHDVPRPQMAASSKAQRNNQAEVRHGQNEEEQCINGVHDPI